jgi:hypothetical protein
MLAPQNRFGSIATNRKISPLGDSKPFSDKMEPFYKISGDRIGADIIEQARKFVGA